MGIVKKGNIHPKIFHEDSKKNVTGPRQNKPLASVPKPNPLLKKPSTAN